MQAILVARSPAVCRYLHATLDITFFNLPPMDSYVFKLLVTVPVSNFNGRIKCNNFPRACVHWFCNGVVLKVTAHRTCADRVSVSVCHDTCSAVQTLFSSTFCAASAVSSLVGCDGGVRRFSPPVGCVGCFLPLLGASAVCWCDTRR